MEQNGRICKIDAIKHITRCHLASKRWHLARTRCHLECTRWHLASTRCHLASTRLHLASTRWKLYQVLPPVAKAKVRDEMMALVNRGIPATNMHISNNYKLLDLNFKLKILNFKEVY